MESDTVVFLHSKLWGLIFLLLNLTFGESSPACLAVSLLLVSSRC